MRRLLLFRHASAAPGIAHEDHARPLDAPGQAGARAMGARLAALGLLPDLVLCSSALRAVETWEAAGPAFSPSPPLRLNDALYLADPGTLLDAIAEVPAAITILTLIGHNPGLHQLAAALASDGAESIIGDLHSGYPAGAVSVLASEAGDWRAIDGGATLEHFLRPR